ncbi:ATP-binding protein [Algoriphagus namhaensis]|uniref:histidine kinase n=1 Tax=Algoriphagus namhaensis TaxID=915353 RepID=A0ABV8AP89_9BACT
MKKLIHNPFFWVFQFCVFILISLTVGAQNLSHNAVFNNLTAEDGLPTTSVTSVSQDTFGYIWIGSWDVAFRYDGKSFEKLASLGQLTAGIAHEIKNPLNFVNNFSDLSRELIKEVFEELENVDDSDTKEEIIAILNDVKSNLAKVHEHGTRADSIVKSMLQHSRASGNKREEKAFNPLVKEFVNLSFHGMRAGKSPINVEIEFQLDPEVGKISLISEDFSRVILNLSNNAFDAMREKLKSSESGRYIPKLTVKTSKLKDKVALSIEDNGPGIPDQIKDKILQPFFTTKKGTEGTGLGLSITHDIVKAHGGELKVESQESTGSAFTIQIPIT